MCLIFQRVLTVNIINYFLNNFCCSRKAYLWDLLFRRINNVIILKIRFTEILCDTGYWISLTLIPNMYKSYAIYAFRNNETRERAIFGIFFALLTQSLSLLHSVLSSCDSFFAMISFSSFFLKLLSVTFWFSSSRIVNREIVNPDDSNRQVKSRLRNYAKYIFVLNI